MTALTAVVVAVYWLFVITRSSTYPMGDDFDVALDFLKQFNGSSSPLDKLQIFFAPHNEHRLVIVRIFVFLDLLLFHTVDFPFLIYVGNVGWTVAFLYAVRINLCAGGSRNAKALIVLVTALLFFSGRHGELMTWPVGSVQQYWQIAFMLGALFHASTKKSGTQLVVVIGYSLLAVLSGAGGVLVFLVVTLYFVFTRRGFVPAILYFATGILAFALYFLLLPGESSASNPEPFNLVHWFTNALVIGFSFVGGVAPRLKIAVVLGLLMVVFALTYMIRRPKDLRSYGLLIVLLTAAATVAARSQLDFLVGISSKYSMYSILALGILASITIPWMWSRSRYLPLVWVAVVGVLYGVNGLATYRNLTDRYLITESGAFNYPWSLPHAREVYEDSDRAGYFPTPFLKVEYYQGSKPLPAPALANIDEFHIVGRLLTIKGWAVDPARRTLAKAVVLTIDDQRRRVLNYGYSRVDVQERLGLERYKTCGFEDSVDVSDLAAGKHSFAIQVFEFQGSGYYSGPEVQQELN